MKEFSSKTTPVDPSARIMSLDVLRGFAVLGILIMNIQSYSMIGAAYINPTAYGNLSGINKWVWVLSHVFANQKFMTVFSILFGAGIVLLTRRMESKGLNAAGVHYRRTFWLLVIALIHAYAFWYGDILFVYSLCAFLVYLFRKVSPRKLCIAGLLVISVASLIYFFFGWSIPQWPQEAYQNSLASWKPGLEAITQEIASYQGSWLEQMSHRVPSSIFHETFLILIWYGWRVTGLMLIGMALYKWGILSAKRSKRFYAWTMILSFGIGLPIVIYGVVRDFAESWSLEFSMFYGWQFNYWGSLLVAFGYICAVMLFCLSGLSLRLSNILASVGRMAFTNYLMQTLICTTLFYGHGFGLFGRVERIGQILIVLCIWLFQLVFSTLWLRSFRFGPVEWLWRSLTYKKAQPFRYE